MTNAILLKQHYKAYSNNVYVKFKQTTQFCQCCLPPWYLALLAFCIRIWFPTIIRVYHISTVVRSNLCTQWSHVLFRPSKPLHLKHWSICILIRIYLNQYCTLFIHCLEVLSTMPFSHCFFLLWIFPWLNSYLQMYLFLQLLRTFISLNFFDLTFFQYFTGNLSDDNIN